MDGRQMAITTEGRKLLFASSSSNAPENVIVCDAIVCAFSGSEIHRHSTIDWAAVPEFVVPDTDVWAAPMTLLAARFAIDAPYFVGVVADTVAARPGRVPPDVDASTVR